MYLYRIIYTSLFFMLFFINNTLSGSKCIIITENKNIIKKEGDCNKRWSPCSTFKIAISLMGYNSGILINETHPNWMYKKEYVDWLDIWKQPHNPNLWFSNSCVWYSQIITKKLGKKKFSDYIKKLAYGNEDVSGDKGKNNGLTNSWLSSSLTISPKEQIAFLQKLISNKLPVSSSAQQITKNIMFIKNLQNEWRLYGKSGSGFQLNKDNSRNIDKQIGWFVGFVQKDDRYIVFCYLIADKEKNTSYASLRAQYALKKELTKILK